MNPVLTGGYSWCRHCGRPGLLTFEHVPPKSVGNNTAVARSDDPFDPDAVLEGVAEWDEGAGVLTLCRTADGTVGCNERASNWRYVQEYRRWHDTFVDRARNLANSTGVDPIRTTTPFTIDLDRGSAEPARFVRQVIGMMLAMQETERLWATYEPLRRLVGPDPGRPDQPIADGVDIAPMRLYMSICNANWMYQHVPGAVVEVDLRAAPLWTPPGSLHSGLEDFLLLSLSPFAFVLTSHANDRYGLDITEWTTWRLGQRPDRTQAHLDIPTADTIDGLPRAMIYPSEYTSKSQ